MKAGCLVSHMEDFSFQTFFKNKKKGLKTTDQQLKTEDANPLNLAMNKNKTCYRENTANLFWM